MLRAGSGYVLGSQVRLKLDAMLSVDVDEVAEVVKHLQSEVLLMLSNILREAVDMWNLGEHANASDTVARAMKERQHEHTLREVLVSLEGAVDPVTGGADAAKIMSWDFV